MRLIPVVRSWKETGRKVIIIIAWSLALSSIAGQALLRNAALGPLDLALLLGVCVLAGALLSDLGQAVIGYIVSITIAGAAMYLLLITPSLLGSVKEAQGGSLEGLWIGIMVRALFPFPFIGSMMASILGAALGERYS